jgi:hypothetical protein
LGFRFVIEFEVPGAALLPQATVRSFNKCDAQQTGAALWIGASASDDL